MGQGADREAGNGATAEQVPLVLRTGLQRGAEAEGDRVPLDVATTTLPANERAVDEGAEPGGEEEGRHPPSLRGEKSGVRRWTGRLQGGGLTFREASMKTRGNAAPKLSRTRTLPTTPWS